MLCYFGGEEIHNEIMNSLLKQNHNSSVQYGGEKDIYSKIMILLLIPHNKNMFMWKVREDGKKIGGVGNLIKIK